jgi:exodeoxyribonuclease-5
MGNAVFLNNPDVVLTQIMRQAEGNPVIWLSNQVLEGQSLKYGVYGNSAVIKKSDLTDYQMINSDFIVSCTNKTRYKINNYFREVLKGIKQLDYPHLNEKVICRKNNWDECINGFYLTNGMTGFVDRIDKSSYNKKTMTMDFRPDFLPKIYKNLKFDYHHMFAVPGDPEDERRSQYMFMYDKFEFAYAVTCHSFQGSQANKVLFLYEDFMRSDDDNRRLLYTGITRAVEQVIIVL